MQAEFFEVLWILPPKHSERLGRKIKNPWKILTGKQSNKASPHIPQIEVRASACGWYLWKMAEKILGNPE